MFSRPLGMNVKDNPLVKGPFDQGDANFNPTPPIPPNSFFLLNGTNFLLLDTTDFLLLGA